MKLLESLKYLLVEAASIDDIRKAIDQKQVCSIYYDGDEPGGKGLREIEPVALGRSKKGNLVFRAWDEAGASHIFKTLIVQSQDGDCSVSIVHQCSNHCVRTLQMQDLGIILMVIKI